MMKTVIDGKTYFHPAAVPASRDFYRTTNLLPSFGNIKQGWLTMLETKLR
jgi:hypothetical protein